MNRRSSLVPIFWAGIAVVALGLAAWVMVAMGERYAVSAVAPREVAARGSLTEEEESTIRLFEQSRVSVVYITTERRLYTAMRAPIRSRTSRRPVRRWLSPTP